jgi:hypothetical protein
MSTTGASFAAKTMYFDNHDKNLKFEVIIFKIMLDLGYCRTRKIQKSDKNIL